MEKAFRYECSNWFNSYSSQRYPKSINKVEYTNIVNNKYPDGMLCVSAEDVDGHFCTLLKCYKTAQGKRYCVFGKHRLYEGFSGPVELVGVPLSLRKCIADFGVTIID